MKQTFGHEVKEKLIMPWRQTAFKAYFFWIFLVFGSFLGIAICTYEEFTKKNPSYLNISHSIATTFIAIIVSSLADLNLSPDFKNASSLKINTIGFLGLAWLLLIVSYLIKDGWSFLPATAGYILSVLVWVLANADNDKLNDDTYYKKMIEKSQDMKKNWSNNELP